MLEINEDTSDYDTINPQNNSGSRHDLNISRALGMAINDPNIDGIMFINIVRVAMGHRTLLSQGGKRIAHVIMDEKDDVELNEDEEIEEILELNKL